MDQDTNPGGGQLVLAGDPKQLGPILRSPLGIEHGLGECRTQQGHPGARVALPCPAGAAAGPHGGLMAEGGRCVPQASRCWSGSCTTTHCTRRQVGATDPSSSPSC